MTLGQTVVQIADAECYDSLVGYFSGAGGHPAFSLEPFSLCAVCMSIKCSLFRDGENTPGYNYLSAGGSAGKGWGGSELSF